MYSFPIGKPMILKNTVFANIPLRRASASPQPPTLALQALPWTPHRPPQGPRGPPKGTPMDPPDPPWSTSGRPGGISKTCSFMIGKPTIRPRGGAGSMCVRLFFAFLFLFLLPPPFVFSTRLLSSSLVRPSSLSWPLWASFRSPWLSSPAQNVPVTTIKLMIFRRRPGGPKGSPNGSLGGPLGSLGPP